MDEIGEKQPTKVLVIFGTGALYGMERGVIEIFDLLRPEIKPHFLLSQTPRRLGLPVFAEIIRRKFEHSFMSDSKGWVRIEKPKSLAHLCKMLAGVVRGNFDAQKAIRNHDILYLASLTTVSYAFFAMIFCRLSGRRVIYHFHDLPPEKSKRLRIISSFVTDFVHNAKLGYEITINGHPYLKAKRHHIISYPISDMSATTEPQSSLQSTNGLRHLLFVGQVSRHKGVDILLDAFETLAKWHHNLTLDLVGGCDDPLIRQRLEGAPRENGCEVRWWGYQDDVSQFLRRAYLYVHPSPPSRFNESFGIGLVEAMSLGIPSVCFRSGALQEIMIQGETGLVCEEEESLSLAGSIDRLLKDRELRNHCGREALRRYAEKYSRVQVKSRWLSALK